MTPQHEKTWGELVMMRQELERLRALSEAPARSDNAKPQRKTPDPVFILFWLGYLSLVIGFTLIVPFWTILIFTGIFLIALCIARLNTEA